MNVKYVYQKQGQPSDPANLARVVAVAAVRLLKGHGPFVINAPFREPTSPTSRPLRRGKALVVVDQALSVMAIGDSLHVRDNKGDVVFSVKAIPALDPRRAAMVQFAKWGVAHEPQIHYAQTRPVDFGFKNLPWTADCSGSTIAYAKAAGAPDPSGNNFNGSGSTDTILANLPRLASLRDCLPGDLVLWHNGADGKHVAVVIQPGRDPLLASHGFEGGPIALRFSKEDTYHGGETATPLRLL